MASIASEIEQLLMQLAPDTHRQRQAGLLRPLNASLFSISLIGLFFMIWPRLVAPIGFMIVGTSLTINILVWTLDRAGRTGLAALLFSLWINLGLTILVAANLLLIPNPDLAVGILFACQMTLSITLAGLLLGAPYAFFFALLNASSSSFFLWRYFVNPEAALSKSPAQMLIAFAVPLSAFMLLITLVTALYQRALRRADQQISAARERIIKDELIRRDLAIARELQLRLYPPPPVVNPALQLAARSVPARETSGDFYDFIEFGDDQLGIVVADVTGKSIAAALMMALARVTIRSEAHRTRSPAEVLHGANMTICRDHSTRQMITAFYGVLDLRTLTLRFSSAGHPYPLLRRGDDLLELELPSLPLGGSPSTRYEEQSLTLQPGDQLFIISDGLIEERNHQRELFGYNRLLPTILASHPSDPEQAVDTLWQTVAQFRGTCDQGDDMTLVVIQALPASKTAPSIPPTRPMRLDPERA